MVRVDVTRSTPQTGTASNPKPLLGVKAVKPSVKIDSGMVAIDLRGVRPAMSVESGALSVSVDTRVPAISTQKGKMFIETIDLRPYSRLVQRTPYAEVYTLVPYMTAQATAITFFKLLQENGDAILLESGDYIIL